MWSLDPSAKRAVVPSRAVRRGRSLTLAARIIRSVGAVTGRAGSAGVASPGRASRRGWPGRRDHGSVITSAPHVLDSAYRVTPGWWRHAEQGSDRAGHSRLGPEGLTFGVPSTGAVVARPGREPLHCHACSPAPNTERRVTGRRLPAV